MGNNIYLQLEEPRIKKLFSRLFSATLSLLKVVTLLVSLPVLSQSNISGVVNTYHQVLEIIPAKACLRVANITAIDVNSRVMIVQMKGADIDLTNSSSFGNVTALNGAGNYEIGTICYISGDSVFLFHQLLNSYDVATGAVQLVQFGEYTSATVTDTLKALPWNNNTGTGGVVALFADFDITLNAPIYADSSGYKGGGFVLSNGTCTNFISGYAYNGSSTSPQNGAYKGEGITSLATTQSGGRGAAANGGGGGNNHNNSGGGGANLSAGGTGGGNSSSAGCTAAFKGVGGKALSSNSGQKIYMGGGGGAGHNNNGIFTIGGGNGGGIIFIWANNINGNNQLISSRGGNGGQSQSDGAGGGGAGGTIILHSSNYTGTLNVNVQGGAGGNSNDAGNLNRCFGGGGGGAGGMVYFTGSTPAVTINSNAGTAGIESGRDAGCAAAQPALDGSNGSVISNYVFTRSTISASYCQVLLPVKLTFFNAIARGNIVTLSWQVQNPEQVQHFIIEKSEDGNRWTVVQQVFALDYLANYTADDPWTASGKLYYRIRITEKNNNISYTPVRLITGTSPKPFFVYPSPAQNNFTIVSSLQQTAIANVFDNTGRLMMRVPVSRGTNLISAAKLPPGIYLLQLGGITEKLCIQR